MSEILQMDFIPHASSKTFQAILNNIDDILAISILSVFFVVFRYAFQNTVEKLVTAYHIVDKTKTQKFAESAFKLFYYSIAWAWGMNVTMKEEFFFNPILCLENFPNVPITQSIKWFYFMQLSFYIASTFCQFVIETRRKDFYQMLAHHGVTSMLIGLSYIWNVHRFGCMVLILHDVNDIILESGKMLIYRGSKNIADGLFLILIGTWVYTRLFLFPTRVLYTTAYLSIPVMREHHIFVFYVVINVLLFAIQIMNFLWFRMMINLLIKTILNKKGIEDDREDDDD